MTSCSGLSSVSYCDKQRAFYYTVHGFLQAEYDLNENERLDTMFRLNVKGTTQFGSALTVSGVVTATADGTASKSEEYERYCTWGAKLHLSVSCTGGSNINFSEIR